MFVKIGCFHSFILEEKKKEEGQYISIRLVIQLHAVIAENTHVSLNFGKQVLSNIYLLVPVFLQQCISSNYFSSKEF